MKVSDILQKTLSSSSSSDSSRTLNVYLQINTSSEDSKSGLSSSGPATSVLLLANHIKDNCPNLKILGLMTIGSWDASHADDADGENPDFKELKRVREILEKEGWQGLELSMGMSADFAVAIRQGSSSVRVGTRIFGERQKKA